MEVMHCNQTVGPTDEQMLAVILSGVICWLNEEEEDI